MAPVPKLNIDTRMNHDEFQLSVSQVLDYLDNQYPGELEYLGDEMIGSNCLYIGVNCPLLIVHCPLINGDRKKSRGDCDFLSSVLLLGKVGDNGYD